MIIHVKPDKSGQPVYYTETSNTYTFFKKLKGILLFIFKLVMLFVLLYYLNSVLHYHGLKIKNFPEIQIPLLDNIANHIIKLFQKVYPLP